MIINRTQLLNELKDFVFGNGGVIIGSPGVGKTFLLKTIASSYCDRCLYLPIDKLGVEIETDLKAELGIKGDFIDYLRNQNQKGITQKSTLIIDGFDAARSEITQNMYLSLIRRVINELRDSWSVVVSVRTYDAMKSVNLLGLFPSSSTISPSTIISSSGIHCQHFTIPKLSDVELGETVKSIPHLASIYSQASGDFKELLRVPFNLWLIEKLLSQNPNIPELSTINSEIQLLTLFWKQRVTDGLLGESRAVLLSKLVQNMVERRSLSMRKDEIYSFDAEKAWQSLLSSEILISSSSTSQRISFSHMILFDYAVSVLLIEDGPIQCIDFLLKDPARPLFLRPSLLYYFTRLWHNTPTTFWNVFWSMLPSTDIHLRMFARLLPTIVIVNEARDIKQLDPLLEKLKQLDPIADEAILRLLQAINILKTTYAQKQELWAHFLQIISENIHRKFAWLLAVIVYDILKQAEQENNTPRIDICSIIGRHILKWIWEQRVSQIDPWYDQLGSSWVVPLVARTYMSNPRESRQLLMKILDFINEKNFPIGYLYRLTEEVDKILPYDPEFVASIYQVVFGHYETSEEKTSFGTPILPLSSTRRQDYEMCQYVLIKEYPHFLKKSPTLATRVIIRFLNSYVIDRHIREYLKDGVNIKDVTQQFIFQNNNAHYLRDVSYIWDATHHIDQPIKMAEELFRFIANLTSTSDNAALINSLLDIFSSEAFVAFIWKRLLATGTQYPEAFAPYLYELCLVEPIQCGPDTIYELGKFLGVASQYFNSDQMIKLEESIISLPNNARDEDQKKYYEHCRDRLLFCIPENLLKTKNAIEILTFMKKTKKEIKNEPLVTFTSKTESYSEEKYLTDQGADLTSPQNAELQKLYIPLEKFASDWHNKVPDINSIRAILSSAHILYDYLKKPKEVHEAIINVAWTHLAACTETIIRGITDATQEGFSFCYEVLLNCAYKEDPKPSPDENNQYNFPFWVPAPRSYAAIGLPRLAQIKPDEELLNAIEPLARDIVPSIRYLAMLELYRLYNQSPTQFCKLAQDRSKNEENRIVREALCRSLNRVIDKDETGIVGILDILTEKELSAKKEPYMSDCVAATIVWLILVRKNNWAINKIEMLLRDPIQFSNPINRLTFYALDYIKPNNLSPGEKPKYIDTAIIWLMKFIDSAGLGINQVVQIYKEQWDEKDRDKLRDIYDPIDKIISRVYINADIRDELHNNKDKRLSEEQRKMFYFMVKPLLEKILTYTSNEKTGLLFASTAYHFMKFLNGVLMYDPQSILHMATIVAKSSEPFGYNLDSLATEEVVKLVERILADFRNEVRDGKSLADLLTLLDIFANTGWPNALRLVWRLDEVFR